MTRAEAKWAISNPETLKAMADGEAIQYRNQSREGDWEDVLGEHFGVEYLAYEFRKKPDPAPLMEPKRWLIWSLKHHGWWGSGQSRYFVDRESAGRYTFEEACECVRRSNQHGLNIPSSAMIEDPDHEPQTKTP